jgi:hypothetical protein
VCTYIHLFLFYPIDEHMFFLGTSVYVYMHTF